MKQSINGIDVHYTTLGKGKPAILLHGWGGTSKSLAPLARNLSKNYEVYNIDIPGFGESSNPPALGWSSLEYAQTLELFIKMNQLINPLLIGHSNGGRIILRHSIKYPQTSKRIVLINSAGIKMELSIVRKILKNTVSFLLPITKIFRNTKIYHFLRKILYKSIREADYLNSEELKNTYLKLIAEDVSDELKLINQNTLLLWGRKDSYTPLWMGEQMTANIKNSKLRVYEYGHGLPLYKPEIVASEIINWSKS